MPALFSGLFYFPLQVTSGISTSTLEIQQERTSRFYLRVVGPLHSRIFTSRTVTADRANKLANRDLTKLQQWRAMGNQNLKKSNRFNGISKTTTLHVHHAFFSISLLSMQNYHMKWPNFKFTLEWEQQGDKFYHLCLNSGMGTGLYFQP